MSEVELVEIVDKGLAKAGMTIDPAVKKSIASLSQGLPPCTHLLARHAALVAVDSERTEITQSDLNQAVSDAVANQQQSIVNAYEKATHSPKSLLKISFARCVYILNLAGDTHPLHTHLVAFQVVGRTPFNADAYQAAYGGPKGVPGNIIDPVRDGADAAARTNGERVQGHR